MSEEPGQQGVVSVTGEPTAPGAADGARSGAPGETQAPPGERRHNPLRSLIEWVVVILVAVGATFGVHHYVAQTFFIPSTSMWPTLKRGDRIVVHKIYGTIHAGTIVVFKTPPAENCGGPPVPDLVKRVVGLPGQTVSAKGGQVYVTGKLLQEPWLPNDAQTYTTMPTPFTVPQGDYFMMGDDRVHSCDSRSWGPVKSSAIVGKVDLIIWPISRWRFF